MNLKEGTTLRGGKYRIIKVLGSGAFGITYLASGKFEIYGPLGNIEVEAKLAIKEFFVGDYNSRGADGHSVTESGWKYWGDYRVRFRKEAENLTKLNHPNIVKVLDVFDENNTTYFVMEYIEGENLNDYLKRNHPLSESEAVDIIKTVGGALQYMHDRKILHLDLKPLNIMRSKSGKISLIDFGLSKQFTDEGNQATSSIMGLGTSGYAPIEQNFEKLKEGEFAPTLDVYALGATFFKLLTGKTPPLALDVLRVGLPTALMSEYSRSRYLVDAIAKAMAPWKEQRCQSVREFLTMLNGRNHEDATELASVRAEATVIDVLRKSPLLGEINGHGYVDLGLPSGLKWATCNIGANSPEEDGDYFAWGETRTKSEYIGNNSLTYGKNVPILQSQGIINSSGILNRSYDAANANWGGTWRMPTKTECDELVNNCTWTWTTQGGNAGYKVTGTNGNSIFLPAAGSCHGSSLYDAGEYGRYWSSTVFDGSGRAYNLSFYSGNLITDWYYRNYGRSVRPVSE